ncbi:MAG: methyltransferase domain-containing protein [bacterium]|nr:methyltransferase domain-containing protein [bacterium]
MADHEYTFDPDAGNNTAASVYRLARRGGPRVLDLGSGPAIVSSHLATNDSKEVTCVDQSSESLAAARGRGIARTIMADLADSDWVDHLEERQFDVIILADVLEHLINPGQLLSTIATCGLLAPGGHLVISIPNAGHEAVVAELVKGRFTYQDTGLLDSTHLRFFTLDTLRGLLEGSGFFITQVERTRRTAEQTSLSAHDATLPTELRDLILQAAPEAQTYQFIVSAEPADAASDLAEAREQLSLLSAELAEVKRVLHRTQDQAERSRLQLKTEAKLADRELALLRQRIQQVEGVLERERKRHTQVLGSAGKAAAKEIAALQRKIDEIYKSRTWKVGRAAWGAFHLPGKVLSKTRPTPSNTVMPRVPAPTPKETPTLHETIDYPLVEDNIVRQKYERALARRTFSGTARNVTIAVYSTDLTEGRGDVYTAVGLGRQLETIGFEVIYLPRDRWYDVPSGTEIFVAMMESVDITQLPSDLATVAWIRNETEVWCRQPWLPLFDLALASSPQSLEAVRRVFAGPTGLLPIGVDTELFAPRSRPDDRAGVVTTVNQWGRERELFTHLKQAEVKWPLALFGESRGLAPELECFSRGPVSFFALPSLYNQAVVVLDDFNHTTAPFGNVNSRVYEAAACGAIVLTNRSNGLDAVGLENLGTFSSAQTISELITHSLGSAGALKGAQSQAMDVDERHSYVRRAAEFAGHLQRLDGADTVDRLVVNFYPDYRANPYLEMMWSSLRGDGSIAIPIADDLDVSAAVRAADLQASVFHLNWTAPILGPAQDDHSRLVRYRRFVEALDELNGRGVPTIWTLHNVLPHECADPYLEAQLRQEIADRVDHIHVMCESTVAACSEWFDVPETKTRMIPHPSYIDVYSNLVDKETARYHLGLQPDDFVYLHFGQIRPYKAIDRLLDAFDRVSHSDPKVKLLLVGKPGRFDGVRQIMERARANPSVIANFNHIPDADVQLYMNAADVAVLPHRQALNSGALLLAYSFGLPVVASATGCMATQVDDLTGVTFDWDEGEQALLNALLDGRQLGPNHGKAAYERAKAVHYLDIGTQFRQLVDEAMSLRRT